ncbi:RagB/SusD family nutrient uptake outer membrane protein [Maribellus comscasis]|uniref:RagB/SusD family nutrient uptake outer membrane protein n=1 Tax=Maribellus comscasis TaxID=2681766 RepID=A0A6I6JNU0_9BACT|nr:RagB/SusD family nutrient uptake outer membrane protein [Maribellus comscasis]QGY44636.1 RagB/SusD family nutrient uptake outer membrane protein [Maribellus comscasis]
MKTHRIINIAYVLATLLLIGGCTNLDVPVESEITTDNFPVTEEDFIAVSGPIYTNLAPYYFKSYWFLQEFSADGLILTANGGNWYDDGRYQNYHMHTWNTEQRFIREVWDWCYAGISSCNSVLTLYESAEDNNTKEMAVAEVKTMRAFYHFILMDVYGDVPLVTTFGEEVTTRTDRTEVFDFLEEDLLDAVNYLSTIVDQSTYGRPTKYMAYALLAKLYINAEIYTGENRYNDVVSVCDEIIDSGSYTLDDDYLAVFDIDNGPDIKDIIFAVTYNSEDSQQQYWARYWLHKALREKFSLPYNPSGCVRALPEYYDLFNDANDRRNAIWLTGKQYDWQGNPITIETTNSGLDADYSGNDPDGEITYHLEFTREIVFDDFDKFDTGDDQLGKAIGYRCNKFYPDSTSTSRQQNNDWPVFRYADVLLMKAEAILRGASATLGQTPLSLVNMVRERSNAGDFNDIDLDGLLDERARELCYEGWRRNDLIRYGKFEDSWGFKTDNDVNKRIYPVPQDELDINPSLGQNPGYE